METGDIRWKEVVSPLILIEISLLNQFNKSLTQLAIS